MSAQAFLLTKKMDQANKEALVEKYIQGHDKVAKKIWGLASFIGIGLMVEPFIFTAHFPTSHPIVVMVHNEDY